jgi:hypothetical protein
MRTALCILAASFFATPAFATTDAYVFIETADGRGSDVMSTNWGFGQCKGLAHQFRPDEIVVQIACDDLPSLQKAVGTDIPATEGVERIILWMISANP